MASALDERMRESQLSTIGIALLDAVHGGQESSSDNYQHDVIGVQVGDTTVGFEKNGGRSNYGMCLDHASKNNWTPEEIATTCNPLATGNNRSARRGGAGGGGGGGGGFG